jgi:hypothetical protein
MKFGRIGLAALVMALAGATVVAAASGVAPRPIRQARRAALRDAYRRLEKVRLPPGSRPVKKVGRGLHLNTPGTEPETPNLVQMHSFFLSPRPREAVVKWFDGHPPAGSRQGISGSFGIGKRTVVKYVGFEWPELRDRVYSRSVEVSVASRPSGGSAIRIDSMAVWVTPRRAYEELPGGIRFIDVRLRAKGHLRRSKVISDPAEVRSVDKLIDGLDPAQPGTVSCPELGYAEKRLTLVFRPARRGPALAEAKQIIPAGCGRPLELTVHGHKHYLEGGYLLLRRLHPILSGGKK